MRAFVSLSSSPPSPISRCATACGTGRTPPRLRALERASFSTPSLSSSIGLGAQPIGLRVVERTHVGLGHGGASPGGCSSRRSRRSAVARDERVVVAAHHQHVAQRRRLRVLRPRVVVEAEVFLRRVGQQVEERGAGFVLGVDLFGLLHHPQRLVLAAGGHARRAALAEVGDEDRERRRRRRASSFPASRRSRWPSDRPSAPCR